MGEREAAGKGEQEPISVLQSQSREHTLVPAEAVIADTQNHNAHEE